MRKPLLVLTWTIVCGLALGGAAVAQDAGAEAGLATPSVACATASLDLGGFDSAIGTARKGGDGIDGPNEATPCCYSDPCPATGQPVSCCADGCSAYTDRVYCSHTGFIVCDPPCIENGYCNQACGSSDPDCVPSCTCDQGSSCFDDSECDCGLGYGFCDKEAWEILGSCSCYF